MAKKLKLIVSTKLVTISEQINLVINLDSNKQCQTLSRREALNAIIKQVEIENWSEPIKIIGGVGFSLYYTESYTPPNVKPFDKVKEHCLEMAKSLKWLSYLDTESSKFRKEFPIQQIGL